MLKKILPFIIILMTDVYFAGAAAIGYSYGGSESSLSYTVFNLALFIMAIFLFFSDLNRKQSGLTVNNLILLFIFLIPIIAFLFDNLMGDVSVLSSDRFIFYLLWCGSGILMGIFLSKKDRYKNIVVFLDYFLWVINLALLRTLYTSLSENTRVALGGETYQRAGYLFAFAFGVNIFLVIYGEKYYRVRFFEKKSMKYLSILFLILQFIGVIASGARGPMVLIIVYTFIFYISSKKTLASTIKNIVLFFVIIIFLTLLIPRLREIPLFSSSLDRVFEYFSSDGIDWSGTSGRDILYVSAVNYFFEKPIFGYGFFRYLTVIGFTAHNLFLEIGLQGGIIYLFVFIITLIHISKKIISIMKEDKYIYPYLVIMIYIMTMLMFSGIYYNNSMFCFFFSFVISYKQFYNVKKKVSI